jgi:hypothetical protein
MLYASIVESKRTNGTVRQHHLAQLGSVTTAPANLDGQPSYRTSSWQIFNDRVSIWQAMHEAIAELAIDAATATKLTGALQERVPYPTEEEHSAALLLQAEHSAAFWQGIHGSTNRLIEARERELAIVQQRIGELKNNAAGEQANIEDAKQKVDRLDNYRGIAVRPAKSTSR